MFMQFLKKIINLQVFKFLISGLFCATIEFLIFNFLAVMINYLIANVIAIVIALGINYYLSRIYIFGNSRYSKTNELLSFVFFSSLAIALNQFILWFFVEYIQYDLWLCKVLTIVAVSIFNFTTKKYIVFKRS